MRKLTVLILVVVVALGLMVSMIGAKGPANKVTGSIWLDKEDLNDEFYAEFNAHEGIDGEPAKGKIEWYMNGELRFELDVVCCHVKEGVAWFAVGPLIASTNRKYLVFKVVDGGTPGVNGDKVYLSLPWVDDLSTACAMVTGEETDSLYTGNTITGGNLVVHFYGE